MFISKYVACNRWNINLSIPFYSHCPLQKDYKDLTTFIIDIRISSEIDDLISTNLPLIKITTICHELKKIWKNIKLSIASWLSAVVCLSDFGIHLIARLITNVSFQEVIDETTGGCGQKFSTVIVSEKFEGKPLLQRHRWDIVKLP